MKSNSDGQLRRARIAVASVAALALTGSLFSQIPAARDVVKPSAYTSFEPVARG